MADVQTQLGAPPEAVPEPAGSPGVGDGVPDGWRPRPAARLRPDGIDLRVIDSPERKLIRSASRAHDAVTELHSAGHAPGAATGGPP